MMAEQKFINIKNRWSSTHMVRRTISGVNRRSFLKTTGTVAVALGLSGCSGGTSEGGSSDDDGSSGGTESAGDSSNTGTTTSQQELQEVRLTVSPFGFDGLIYDQMVNETNRLENRMNDAGYTVTSKESWENAALFAAGGPDFTNIAELEAASLAAERDLQLATVGQTISNFVGWITRTGSRFDPEESGSLQNSIELIANDGRLAIGSWGGGDVPAEKVILRDRYDLTLDEDQGDFEVVTADYFALPELVTEGEVAAVSTAPQYGAPAPFMGEDPSLKGLFWIADMLDELGYGPRAINGWTTTQQFVDENRQAVDAIVRAQEETVSDFLSRPYELSTQEKYMEYITAGNEDQARFLVDFCVKNEYSFSSPLVYEDVALDQETIEKQTAYLDRAAELGTIPENWGDFLNLVNIDS